MRFSEGFQAVIARLVGVGFLSPFSEAQPSLSLPLSLFSFKLERRWLLCCGRVLPSAASFYPKIGFSSLNGSFSGGKIESLMVTAEGSVLDWLIAYYLP